MDMPDLKGMLDSALFPVELSPIYIESSVDQQLRFIDINLPLSRVPGFHAVVAQDNNHVFSVVSKGYRLIDNDEALELGKACFKEVFKLLDVEQMEVFNVIMPQTRSFCHIDFVHPEGTSNYFDDDPWTPYLRITNSYNRMFALNFELGFCRGLCKNGVIFGKKNIEFKFYHSHSSENPQVSFKLKQGEFASLEAEFVESLKNLKRFHVPPSLGWPLVCKVFGFKLGPDPTTKQVEVFDKKRTRVRELVRKYFSEMGENGYAALNVLTDYASSPVGMISAEMNINSMQRKAGGWIDEFIAVNQSASFNFNDYLGEYGKYKV